MAQQNFPRDRFDEVVVGGKRGLRLGAHRTEPRQSHLLRWAFLVFSLTLLCTLAGVLWLMQVGADSTVFSSAKEIVQQEQQTAAENNTAAVTTEPEAAPAENTPAENTPAVEQAAPESVEAVPQLRPDATVAVLNGTLVPGAAGVYSTQISANGWGVVQVVGNAPTQNVAVSTVIYVAESDADAAAALARELGGFAVRFDAAYAGYGGQLIVEIGADRAAG